MPETAKLYRLYLQLGSCGTLRFAIPYYKDGLPYFPGFELWENRYHKGDGPLFHARSYSYPPSQYINIGGERYLYLGSETIYDGYSFARVYCDGREVIVVQAVLFMDGGSKCHSRSEYCIRYVYRLGNERSSPGYYDVLQWQGNWGSTWERRYYDDVEDMVAHVLANLPSTPSGEPHYAGYVRPSDSYDALVAPFPASEFQFNYRHNEWDAYMGSRQLDADLLPNLYRSGFSSAYINAIEDIPEVQCNNLANLLDVIDLIRDIKKFKFSDFVRKYKNWRELWLSYRYVVNTTKADLEEMQSVSERLQSVLKSMEPFKIHGTFKKDEMTFRCTATLDPTVLLPSDTSSYLKKAGFELSAYNAWDLIPYSFVVDWFLHIGDLIEWAERFREGVEVPVDSCWYSYEAAYSQALIYFRVKCSGILGTPFLTPVNTSSRTLLMRLSDAVALFTK